MNRKRARWWLLGLVLFGLLGVVLSVLPQRPDGQTPEAQLSPARRRVMAPEKVARLINPQPGATVVDLGTGFGLYTFSLAEVVGEAGTVYATDVDPSALDYIAGQAHERGVANIHPVLVSARGLDPFYRQHTFDAILVADLLPTLPQPHPFFDQLRPSLKADTGRLWVIHPRPEPDFDIREFGDFAAVRDLVRSRGTASPIIGRLRPQVQEALAADLPDGIPEALQRTILEDLNRLLEDSTLWPAIQEQLQPGQTFFHSRLQDLAEYLVRELETAGVFASDPEMLPEGMRPSLRLLNRCIIQEVFKTDEWDRTFHLEGLSGSARKGAFLAVRERPARAVFLETGYELVREHPILVYHHVWEFRRAR